MSARSARWGSWQIGLKPDPLGWAVTVWEWPVDAPLSERKVLGKGVGQTERDAVSWACALLKDQGARVFIDGSERDLAPFLAFTPAPEVSS